VLAKRKTAMMKDMEADKANMKRIKLARIERKAEQTKQLVVPDVTTADYERQLKKLATRGGKISANDIVVWLVDLSQFMLINAFRPFYNNS
jgi:ribosomal protein L18E